MKTFLGVDGGGTKTRFLLIDETGKVLASHLEGPAYYLEIGLDGLREMLTRGIGHTLRQGHVREEALSHAFLGLPAYGEDSSLLPDLDDAPAHALPHGRYRCGNDMVCGWAGALAGADGINIVSGTGSIAYGEFAGRNARAGGWGELFSDEGSSYWLAREGLQLFSRMSDGRSPRGALYGHVRRHFSLRERPRSLRRHLRQGDRAAQPVRAAFQARDRSREGRRSGRARAPGERRAGARGHRRCGASPTADPRRGAHPGVLLRGHVSTGKRSARAVRVGAAAAVRAVSVRRGLVAARCGSGHPGRQTQWNSAQRRKSGGSGARDEVIGTGG